MRDDGEEISRGTDGEIDLDHFEELCAAATPGLVRQERR